MKYNVKKELLPMKEFLVIKGYGKLYDPNVSPAPNEDTWEIIRRQLNDGSVERLKKTAGSESVYMLFCYTCVRNDDEKGYVCSYDIACENLNGVEATDGFEIVQLNQCEYAVFDCEFDSETTMQDAHEKPDALFWDELLKENPYICPIDFSENWKGNGFAAIEQYTPFDPGAEQFNAKMWFPITKKD